MAETTDLTFTITGEDGDEATFTVPEGLVDMLSEPGDDPADVVADVATMAFTSRAHAVVHHSDHGDDEQLQAVEARSLELFEERFGMTYGEATGHSH